MKEHTTMVTLGISSIWRASEIRDGQRLLEALTQVGLNGMELEYRITSTTFSEMLPLLKSMNIQVWSVHNYFPLPEILSPDKAGGDAFALSSPDLEERRLALRYTMRTIEVASDLGARAVVLHLGRVEMEEPMEHLKQCYREGGIGSEKHRDILSLFFRERGNRQERYFNIVRRNLGALIQRAEQLGISLGIENRYYLREIPNFQETRLLLEEFSGAPIGYWHDVGHAATQENLGIEKQKDWLDAYGDTLLGVHLHDAVGYEDHLAPLQGEVRFESIYPFFNDSVIKILEVRPTVSPEAIQTGITYLKALSHSVR